MKFLGFIFAVLFAARGYAVDAYGLTPFEYEGNGSLSDYIEDHVKQNCIQPRTKKIDLATLAQKLEKMSTTGPCKKYDIQYLEHASAADKYIPTVDGKDVQLLIGRFLMATSRYTKVESFETVMRSGVDICVTEKDGKEIITYNQVTASKNFDFSTLQGIKDYAVNGRKTLYRSVVLELAYGELTWMGQTQRESVETWDVTQATIGWPTEFQCGDFLIRDPNKFYEDYLK